ncbi:type II toxin-antitoxin system RelE/ParE family toxin [Patescibacteria group bacterium]|nr:type II toxin-antitoxin system RelE/ParE family toxin [Patescibacteria group bacterium]
MPKYIVKFTDYGYKSLGQIAASDAKRVLKKLKILENFSSQTQNIKKMKGSAGQVYRLRIGDIRVLFERDKITIWILEIGYRGSIY